MGIFKKKTKNKSIKSEQTGYTNKNKITSVESVKNRSIKNMLKVLKIRVLKSKILVILTLRVKPL